MSDNYVIHNSITFDDSNTISQTMDLNQSLICDDLQIDSAELEVESNAIGDGKLLTVDGDWYSTKSGAGYTIKGADIREISAGSSADFYMFGSFWRRFYADKVVRKSFGLYSKSDKFQLSYKSFMGRLAELTHYGGVYNGTETARVIGSIINGKDYAYGRGTTGTYADVDFTKNDGGTWTIDGTATSAAARSIYTSQSAFPAGMAPGGTYWVWIENGGQEVQARIRYYVNSTVTTLVTTSSKASFTIPETATGLVMQFYVANGKTINNATCILRVTSQEPLFDYTVDSDVAVVPLYGYLPIASCRDNLQQVLFAVGANLTYTSAGNPRIRFLKNLSATTIPDSRILMDESISYGTPATKVVLTEHSYYQSALDQEVSLFDNTTAAEVDNRLVTFKNPCYNLVPVGLTVSDSGANYAIVSGTGTLTGTEYTHSTKTREILTGEEGKEKLAVIKDAYLVGPLNSVNVAARVADYQAAAEVDNISIVLQSGENLQPGSKISYNDPNGDAVTGLITDMRYVVSETTIADCKVVKNYTPSHFGNNVSRRWSPSGTSGTVVFNHTGPARIVLIGGGQGGQGGSKGQDSQDAYAGEGGLAGAGGSRGKVFTVDIDVTAGDSFAYSKGTGGAGGAASTVFGTEGSLGADGTATTFGSYSSNDGIVPTSDYVDIFTGTRYAKNGAAGIGGAQGGRRGASYRGGSITYNGTTWTGGLGCAKTFVDPWNYSAAGGGGASYGANGIDAEIGEQGGDGASASVMAGTAQYGSGGAGGNGGGGGGAGMSVNDMPVVYPYDAAGGTGSAGQTGGAGQIIIYY